MEATYYQFSIFTTQRNRVTTPNVKLLEIDELGSPPYHFQCMYGWPISEAISDSRTTVSLRTGRQMRYAMDRPAHAPVLTEIKLFIIIHQSLWKSQYMFISYMILVWHKFRFFLCNWFPPLILLTLLLHHDQKGQYSRYSCCEIHSNPTQSSQKESLHPLEIYWAEC